MCRHSHLNLDKSHTTTPPEPGMVADVFNEELAFMRILRVYHEGLVSYQDKSGLKPIGTFWVYTNKGDAANPFIPSPTGCARNEENERVNTSGCLTAARMRSRPPTGESQFHAQSMHDWQPASTC